MIEFSINMFWLSCYCIFTLMECPHPIHSQMVRKWLWR